MDWKHAKTLFIIVFVLVNIGLIVVYINKVNNSVVQESNAQSEVNFSKEGIKIPKLPEYNDKEMQAITGRSKTFNSDSAVGVYSLTEKDTQINKDIDLEINKEQNQNTFKQFIDKESYKGNDYQYSKDASNKNKAIYEQTYEGLPILSNNKGQIAFNLENDKANKYTQTYLDKLKPGNGDNNHKQKIATARTALETLYFNTYLKKGDTVQSVRLGYYSVVKEISGQVLVPSWEVKIKTKENGKDKTKYLYIDAIKPESTVLEES